jgi:hypothetical protein
MVYPSDNQDEQADRVEEYGGLLDVVETQLLQEIAVRSDHFFEAAAVVQDLGDNLGRAYEHVHNLRSGVRTPHLTGMCSESMFVEHPGLSEPGYPCSVTENINDQHVHESRHACIVTEERSFCPV